MRSIRTYLTGALLVGSMALWMASGTATYFAARNDLISSAERGLLARAGMLIALSEDENGRIRMDLPQDGSYGAYAGGGSEYFQVWDGKGRDGPRSQSLGAHELPRPAALTETPHFFEFTLPNGRAGRGVAFSASLGGQNGDNQQGQQGQNNSSKMRIVAATDDTELHSFLWRLVTILGVAAGVFAIALAALVTILVARGLAPLKELAARADSIDADSLQQRFPAEGMPSELRPICLRLNDLLVRLEASFERERRFSSDVAHELRTPIAELRSLAEVALKWPEDPARTQETLREARQIALQMEAIASALLALMRCETGVQAVSPEPVDLGDLVENIWRSMERRACERGLRFSKEIAPGESIVTDRALLRGIVANLLGNAVDHGARDGSIRVSFARDGETFALVVASENDSLLPEDLPHLFERYWRKNKVRGNSLHSGLGLSLASAFARALGFRISASLSEEAMAAFTVTGSLGTGQDDLLPA